MYEVITNENDPNSYLINNEDKQNKIINQLKNWIKNHSEDVIFNVKNWIANKYYNNNDNDVDNNNLRHNSNNDEYLNIDDLSSSLHYQETAFLLSQQ